MRPSNDNVGDEGKQLVVISEETKEDFPRENLSRKPRQCRPLFKPSWVTWRWAVEFEVENCYSVEFSQNKEEVNKQKITFQTISQLIFCNYSYFS